MTRKYLIDEVNTASNFLQLRDPESSEIVIVKPDGSAHFSKGSEYFKIDNVDDWIERLQLIKEHAARYFSQ